MSPLACSLFALAALLATAHGDCNYKHVGRKTDTQIPLEPGEFIPPLARKDEVNTPDQCPPGLHMVGLDVAACNKDPDGPAPDIYDPPQGKLFPIYVFCAKDDCPTGGYIQVTLHCGHSF